MKKYSLVMEEEKDYSYSAKAEDSDSVFEFLIKALHLNRRPEEHFIIMSLNTKAEITAVFDNTTGGVAACAIAPAEVFKSALASNASSVIVAHNHPSGDCSPSACDDETTKRLIQCGKILGVPVVDHLIIGEYRYYDYRSDSTLFDN